MSESETYEVYAIRYAHRADRYRYETFITNAWTDPLHDTLQPISYYVWAIVGRERTFVVDTGFDARELESRRRESGDRWQPSLLCSPAEGLAQIGVDAATVRDVVVTHLHFDHAGTLEDFPSARFHLQEGEMQYATGPHMAHSFFNGAYSVGHVVRMVEHVYRGRVAFHAGDAELAPGITLHLVGGHTPGIQSVRVRTRRGWVVLASDASHFYDNVEENAPYPIVHDVAGMLAGFTKLRSLASSPNHIIPGHDPEVMDRYPAASDSTRG